jgi:hypothetical protein
MAALRRERPSLPDWQTEAMNKLPRTTRTFPRSATIDAGLLLVAFAVGAQPALANVGAPNGGTLIAVVLVLAVWRRVVVRARRVRA